jgi:predicted transglutaminase-like cysteine proteinase
MTILASSIRSLTRHIAAAIAITVLVAAPNQASSKPRSKIAMQAPGSGAALLVSPDESAPIAAAPAPLQYFTINEILKRRAEGPVRERPVRLASLGPHGLRGSLDGMRDPRPEMRNSDEPFGLVTFRAPEGLLWVKWRKVAADVAKEAEVLAACRRNMAECSPPARRFLAIINQIKSATGRHRLELANHLLNSAIRYTSDTAQYGLPDVWSSPLATLATGRGDCEDYAIAKYAALREAGVAARDLKLMLVIDRAVNEAHAVLTVRHEENWLVLDNRRAHISTDKQIGYFTPLFAIDHEGVKLLATQYAANRRAAGPRQAASSSTWLEIDAASNAGNDRDDQVVEIPDGF